MPGYITDRIDELSSKMKQWEQLTMTTCTVSSSTDLEIRIHKLEEMLQVAHEVIHEQDRLLQASLMNSTSACCSKSQLAQVFDFSTLEAQAEAIQWEQQALVRARDNFDQERERFQEQAKKFDTERLAWEIEKQEFYCDSIATRYLQSTNTTENEEGVDPSSSTAT